MSHEVGSVERCDERIDPFWLNLKLREDLPPDERQRVRQTLLRQGIAERKLEEMVANDRVELSGMERWGTCD